MGRSRLMTPAEIEVQQAHEVWGRHAVSCDRCRATVERFNAAIYDGAAREGAEDAARAAYLGGACPDGRPLLVRAMRLAERVEKRKQAGRARAVRALLQREHRVIGHATPNARCPRCAETEGSRA